MTTRERLLSEDRFENESFIGVDLSGVDLSRKELEGCTFRNAKLSETRWLGTVLEDCVFETCDLSNMSPKGLTARDVRFRECKLLGVDWSGVTPSVAVSFDGCDLRYAQLVKMHLRKTKFLRCTLVEAAFVEVDLMESDFEGSDLTGATFRDCVLKKADFTQARGVLIDATKNQVKDVRVSVEAAVLLATSLGMRVSGFERVGDARARR
jgi:uncharacterized protein YjbI with pentapeptide repeats